jgi:starch phosphorylase
VSVVWRDQPTWTRQSILTVARSGRFSSDRAIREYCDQIWKVRPVPVEEDQSDTGPAVAA